MKKKGLVYAFMLTAALGLITQTKSFGNAITKIINYEKFDLKDDILKDIVKAYMENETIDKNSVAQACGYFYKSLKGGYVSVDNEYNYNDDNIEIPNYVYNNDFNCIMGIGQCRDENLMISKLLNMCGFDTVTVLNSTNNHDYLDHVYILVYDDQINKKYIYDFTNDCFWKINDLSNVDTLKDGYKDFSSISVFRSFFIVQNFNVDDLIKINSYDNNEDFTKLKEEYEKGKKEFTVDDAIKLLELTETKKEKIKKLEQE